MLHGYARVSTCDQDTSLQIDALKRAGVRHIVHESVSGVGNRVQLDALLTSLRPGDVLVVWKLDRVARSLHDLLRVLERLKRAGAAIRSLTEPIDTSTPIGEFTFQILGAVAQLERSMIRERVMAGQDAARARGKRWGPPRTLTALQERRIVARYTAGGVTQRQLADDYGVGIGAVKLALGAEAVATPELETEAHTKAITEFAAQVKAKHAELGVKAYLMALDGTTESIAV